MVINHKIAHYVRTSPSACKRRLGRPLHFHHGLPACRRRWHRVTGSASRSAVTVVRSPQGGQTPQLPVSLTAGVRDDSRQFTLHSPFLLRSSLPSRAAISPAGSSHSFTLNTWTDAHLVNASLIVLHNCSGLDPDLKELWRYILNIPSMWRLS